MALPGFFKGTEMPTAGWWEALWPDPAMVLNQVGIRAGMTVIDLCSGDGWFTLQIAKIAGHVVAVDIDADLLDVAKLRLARVPILMAPMGNASPTSLAIAVANAGGLAGCGSVGMQPDAIRAWTGDVRAGSNGAFQLNLWIPDPAPKRDLIAEDVVRRARAGTQPRAFCRRRPRHARQAVSLAGPAARKRWRISGRSGNARLEGVGAQR